MTENFRTCKCCGEIKPIEDFYLQGGKAGKKGLRVHRCKKCCNSNLALSRKGNRSWIEYRKKWKKESDAPSSNNFQYVQKTLKLARNEFRDSFVAKKLGMKISDIPPTLMEVKRAQLKLNRLIYEQENKQHQ